MAQKVVGYREMIWTCPNCGAKNPGSVRVCRSCGAAMSEDVKFEQQTQSGMISDEKIIEQAQQGPDIYCAYCGNRNPAGAKTCSRCGADLSEGTERVSGTLHSAHLDEQPQGEPILCTACGAQNPAGSLKCRSCGAPLAAASTQKDEIQPTAGTPAKGSCGGRGCLIIILILVLFGLIFVLFGGGGLMSGLMSTPVPNQVLDAVVVAQNWRTSVQVIGPVDTRQSGWEFNIPDGARNVRCEDRLYKTYDDEVDGAVEVCGTSYARDMGNGYEQFVQDCVYEVYYPYCQYTVTTTGVIGTRDAEGSGPNPELPYVESSYSTGSQSAAYTIVFRDDSGREYTLNMSSLNLYRSYTVGSEYRIEVNSRGAVVNTERK